MQRRLDRWELHLLAEATALYRADREDDEL